MRRKNPIRVLVIGASNIGFGGRSTSAYNLVKGIEPTVCIIDFFCEGNGKPRKDIIKAIEDNQGTVYWESDRSYNYIQRQYRWLNRLKNVFQNQSYNIVHIHCDNAQEAFRSIIGISLFSTPKIVVHGHTSRFMKETALIRRILAVFLKRIVYRRADAKLACSYEAWQFLYGSYVKHTNSSCRIIKNGIEPNKYVYNQSIRDSVRRELDLDGYIVIGHIGNFYYPKNHKRIIDIFFRYHELNSNSKLILIGTGNLLNEIREYTQKKGLDKSVIFLGYREDTSMYYQAMDLFLMPSFFEGVPLSGVEAQCSDLPCLFSDTVSREVKILDDCCFLPLTESNDLWCEAINRLIRGENRLDVTKQVRERGYDIKDQRANIIDVYRELE